MLYDVRVRSPLKRNRADDKRNKKNEENSETTTHAVDWHERRTRNEEKPMPDLIYDAFIFRSSLNSFGILRILRCGAAEHLRNKEKKIALCIGRKRTEHRTANTLFMWRCD